MFLKSHSEHVVICSHMTEIANDFIISLIAHIHNAQLLFSFNVKEKKIS